MKVKVAKGLLKKVVYTVFFGLVCLVFVFLGVGSELGGGTTSGAAIEVNGRPISAREFLEQESRLQEYYSQFFKDFKPAEKKLFYGTLKRQAAQQLIENEITYQIAKEQNIYAAPEEIRDRLLSFKALYKDGRFSHELYNNFLRNRNMSASYFEKQLEKALVILKLRKLMEREEYGFPRLVHNQELLESHQIQIDYVQLKPETLKKQLKINSKELKDFSEKPENQDSLKKRYKDQAFKYKTKEEVKARHILISFEKSKGEGRKKALKKAEALLKKVNNKNFANLARKYSFDSQSAKKGGDLGWFGRGKMVPPFEKEAFSLAKGEISATLVRSNFGYHIIQVQDRRPSVQRPFEEVKKTVAEELIKIQKLETVLSRLGKDLEAKKFASVKKWLKKHKVKLKNTGWFVLTRLDPPGLKRDLVKVSLEEAKKGDFVPRLVTHEGKDYVLKLKDFKKVPVDDAIKKRSEKAVGDLNGSLYEAWFDERSKQFTIRYNPKFFAGTKLGQE